MNINMLTPERWQDVKAVFHSALERGTDERAVFLAQACAGDEALHTEVAALLAAHEQTGEFLDAPAYAVAATLLADDLTGLAVGQSLGHYEIVGLLGAGGMGEVYLARDTKLERAVALKILPAEAASDQQRMHRFLQEAKTASALNHPNIIVIHEIGEIDNTHFIATEFIEGETLRERLKRSAFTVNEILDVGIQIASALQAAHGARIVHRDIKPENVMVRPDGLVKVLDFGLAKLTGKTAADKEAETRVQVQTQAGMILGTAAYMSPEQARGKTVDTRTDIFSLGVVLYEMLAGRPPFTGETINHTIVAILEQEPPPLSQFVQNYPGEIERIVGKALAKNADERYQTGLPGFYWSLSNILRLLHLQLQHIVIQLDFG